MNDFNQLLVLAVFFNDFRNGILDYSELDIVLFRCLFIFFFLVAGLSTGTEHLALKTQGECQS